MAEVARLFIQTKEASHSTAKANKRNKAQRIEIIISVAGSEEKMRHLTFGGAND